MTRKVFVTGTGTDVGKTVIAAALVRGWQKHTQTSHYWKPIQTGLEVDWDTIKRLSPDTKIHPALAHYPDPISPDQAVLRSQRPATPLAKMLDSLREIDAEPLVVEGAGGLLVPLGGGQGNWRDFLSASGLEPILVAHTGLGTLNHTAMTIEAMDLKGLKPSVVVLSGPEHRENLASLKDMFPDLAPRIVWFPQINPLEGTQEFHDQSLNLARFVDQCLEGEEVQDVFDMDRQWVWHPFTQHKTAPPPLELVRGAGVWLTDREGKRYMDATSSWWVNSIGHGRREIASAIARQQAQLDHVIFAGTCHEPAAKLSQRMVELSHGHLQRVFFTDNGSCAVEVGVKMAIQSFHNRGINRSKIVCLKGGYHGDTFGAMSLSGTEGFHGMFQDQLFSTLKIAPVTSHPSEWSPRGSLDRDQALLEARALFEEESESLAGILIEPLVQGAGGMLMHDEAWLLGLQSLAHEFKIPLILDEVFTGLGRLGTYFAFQRAGLKPDIVCIAKGLTGGNLPLALTMATGEIFEAFLSDDKSKALFHGHSYTANPIACAAANATLEIYEKEQLLRRSRQIEARFRDWARMASDEFKIMNGRVQGAILAFEWPGTLVGDYFSDLNSRIIMKGRDHGFLIRPLGNTTYFVPPLTISDEELEFGLKAIESILREVR